MDLPEVIVHGGVHKTATSHIQSLLKRNAGRLRKCGVHYLHHRDTRKEFTYPCQLHGYGKMGMNFQRKYTEAELRSATDKFFRNIGAKSGERIILSDENMPGHCGQCVSDGKLYNRRSVLLPIFAREIPFPVKEVHIAIRNYADFFASAYVEYLRSATAKRPLFTEVKMKQGLLSALPSWVEFITEVRETFAEAKILIWRFEDFRALEHQVMQNLIGPALMVEDLVQPKRSRGRPSASHVAIRELQMSMHCEGIEAGLARRVEIQEAYPRGPKYPSYDPWTETQRAHLTRVYDSDIARIVELDGVFFLNPDRRTSPLQS